MALGLILVDKGQKKQKKKKKRKRKKAKEIPDQDRQVTNPFPFFCS